MAIGFDNEKYLAEQEAAIQERMTRFSNKLYLEFGGKLLFDFHASRVLPGFDPNVKIIKFSRNFGHQVAITAGMDMAKGDAVVIIDADLQQPGGIQLCDRGQPGPGELGGDRNGYCDGQHGDVC